MKKPKLIGVLVFAAFLAMTANVQAQVVVKEKPTPPQQYMIPPPKPGSHFVLIPGHWIWSRQQKMYVWVVPGWVPEKEDYIWRPGYWREVGRGWKWIPGRWEREDKEKKWFSL